MWKQPGVGIARNAINDHHRAKRSTAELEDLPYGPEDPADEDLSRRLSRSVKGMLEALPPEGREALYLTEYEGLTQKEFAGSRLGIGLSGATSRVQCARTRLEALLLDCCHFELDRRGRVINYHDRNDGRPGVSGGSSLPGAEREG